MLGSVCKSLASIMQVTSLEYITRQKFSPPNFKDVDIFYLVQNCRSFKQQRQPMTHLAQGAQMNMELAWRHCLLTLVHDLSWLWGKPQGVTAFPKLDPKSNAESWVVLIPLGSEIKGWSLEDKKAEETRELWESRSWWNCHFWLLWFYCQSCLWHFYKMSSLWYEDSGDMEEKPHGHGGTWHRTFLLWLEKGLHVQYPKQMLKEPWSKNS